MVLQRQLLAVKRLDEARLAVSARLRCAAGTDSLRSLFKFAIALRRMIFGGMVKANPIFLSQRLPSSPDERTEKKALTRAPEWP